ncbi:MAG: hypothetical protein WC282_02665 [Bacilli bacterium]
MVFHLQNLLYIHKRIISDSSCGCNRNNGSIYTYNVYFTDYGVLPAFRING